MKKLILGTFVFVLTSMLFANVFARNLDIIEYCGENGLINRGNNPVQAGDILNVQNDIIQDTGSAAYGPEENRILSYGITINGKNHEFDGNGFDGFKMMQYSTGMDCDSTINDSALTNYDDDVITVNERYTYDDSSYGLTLNNVKISSSSGDGVKAKGDLVNIKLNNCTIEDLGGSAIFTEQADLTIDNVKISSVTDYGVNASSAVAKIKNSTIEKTGVDAIFFSGIDLTMDNIKISSVSECGVNISSGTAKIRNSTIKNTGASAIYAKGENSNVVVENVTIANCGDGVNVSGAYAELRNVKISSMSQEGIEIGADGEVLAVDCDIKDTYYEAFYVLSSSTATIVTTRDFTYGGGSGGYNSIDNNGTIKLLPKAGTSVKLSSGISGSGSIVVGDGEQYTGTLVLGGDSTYSGDVEMNGTTIKLLADSNYFQESNHTVWNGTLDILNNSSDTINISSLTGSKLKINLDVNLADIDASDSIDVSSADIEKVIINKINVSSDSAEDVTNVEVISENVGSSTILASSQKRVFGPIYGYDIYISSTGVSVNEQADSDSSNGQAASASSGVIIPSDIKTSTTGHILTFSRAQDSYNPDILQGKVAIAGTNISQEEVFDAILNNAGNYTFFQKQGSNAGDVEDRAAPTLWVKAFGSQEDVDLEKYTKVKTTYYGAVVGLDWDRQYTDNFDATYGLFASYIGGELKDDEYSSNKVKQNGGYAGLRGNWYIGKLFINGILDYGMIQNSADTSSDSNDFNSQVIGLAARLGYNFEVARRNFTIQPSVGATGKYILTDDFETTVSNGDKLKEKIDDIQNITIEPGLKLALNLGKCWILTGEGKYVIENFSGDVKIESEDLELVLPDMSYKNYTNVGLGIEKIWGYTVLHVKGNKTFGGRDGFIVNAGIEFKF